MKLVFLARAEPGGDLASGYRWSSGEDLKGLDGRDSEILANVQKGEFYPLSVIGDETGTPPESGDISVALDLVARYQQKLCQ